MNNRLILIIALTFLVSASWADIRHEKETRMKFKGMMGMMMKLAGANKPIRSVDYLSGYRSRSDAFDEKGKLESSSIIDLDAETITQINYKDKSYSVLTFEEWKAKMSEVMDKYKSESAKAEAQNEGAEHPGIKGSFDVNVERPGDTQKIGGHQTEKVVILIDMKGEAEQPESADNMETQAFGMKVRTESWVARDLNSDEMQAFGKKMVEKLGMVPGEGGLADIVAGIQQQNPQLAEAMETVQEKMKDLDGVALNVYTTYTTWAQGDQSADAGDAGEETPKSVGGMFGKFVKKKMQDRNKDKAEEGSVLLETTTETKAYDTSALSAEVFKVPAKKKKKEWKM